MDHSLLPNIYHFIAQLDPFNKLPTDLLKKISSYIAISYLAEGEYIKPDQMAGRHLYIIRTGAIEQRESNGEILTRLDQGDVFGFTMLIDKSSHRFQAKALENTLLYMLSADKFSELSDEPLFAAHFAIQYQTRLKSALQYSISPDNPLLLKSVYRCCPSNFVNVSPNTSIQAVASQMAKQRSSSAIVTKDEKLVGLISDRNLTKRVISTGMDIDLPVSEVMTKAPSTIDANNIVLQAISKMMQYGVQHLPVMRGQNVIGVVNASDLIQKHSVRAVYLIEAIKNQNSTKKLANLTPQRHAIFEALVETEIRPSLIAQVMTMIADAFTTRLIELAEMDLIKRDAGEPPCTYAWMAAGSQARYEMQLVSDQDNAIVLADDATESDRAYFKKLAQFVCQGLDDCGYELCPGGIMASNSRWCQSTRIWKRYYKEWITKPELEALLNVSVFLDIRCLHGNTRLVDQLQQYITQLVSGNKRFISTLLSNSLRISPPLGFFRTFVLVKNGEHKNTLNIKKRAVNPLIDMARVYGLLSGCKAPGSNLRLQNALEEGVLNQSSYDDLMGAYNFVCSVRLRHQLMALREGKPINNYLSPESLSQFERNHLRDAFRVISNAQEVAKLRYSSYGMLR